MKVEYKSERELFDSLKGAFNVKLRLIKDDYDYITNVDIKNVDLYLKGKIKEETRKLED